MKEAGTIAEVLSLVGTVGALLLGAIWLILRLGRGSWVSTAAEVVDGELRWMLPDGTVHRSTLPTDAPAPSGDELEIHYRTLRPDVPHREPVAHDERGLLLVTLILFGVGVVSFVASTILGALG
ncbi:hypothetical protein M2152_002341 [Microbacteriaceae bacterium SG_E_30_P1]|uniref:Sortase n=1 Tax=Antiquaquibacter oligotrophicus TaxID=2880260 RepID=A0ABT6KQA7_9MICO|nr:hypothetical protein [Antiquaquibacter oligotrophicus]MDH6182159.1 hypothetical protein [Antiquaquibacter oligotrophicus]UDF12178.1 hypothetical protein LH407_08365 [Antiquaquibacter oligotrophicus]